MINHFSQAFKNNESIKTKRYNASLSCQMVISLIKMSKMSKLVVSCQQRLKI